MLRNEIEVLVQRNVFDDVVVIPVDGVSCFNPNYCSVLPFSDFDIWRMRRYFLAPAARCIGGVVPPPAIDCSLADAITNLGATIVLPIPANPSCIKLRRSIVTSIPFIVVPHSHVGLRRDPIGISARSIPISDKHRKMTCNCLISFKSIDWS